MDSDTSVMHMEATRGDSLPLIGSRGRSEVKRLDLRGLDDHRVHANHLNFVVISHARAPGNAASAAEAANDDTHDGYDDWVK